MQEESAAREIIPSRKQDDTYITYRAKGENERIHPAREAVQA